MCGIAGIFDEGFDFQANPKIIHRMTDSLLHRGPDGAGYFLEQGVALGHRRLSIIDLAGGDQPIFNEDNSVCIVFNGEIYNYKEIRQGLLKRGHQLKTESDTEVIVHLYEEMGPDCVKELNGMFAFAIWDKTRRRMFISRDRLGEKPLYYHYCNNRLVFGSEAKALAAHPDLKLSLNPEVLDDYLSLGYVPQPKCIFRDVHKLPAGHSLVLENDRLSVTQYWDVEFNQKPWQMNSKESIESLENLLNDSIRLRLRSDVPVGAFLSGGIDSSLIVALAAQQMPTLSTFSVGFSEEDYDELAFARQVASRYQTNHHEIVVKELDEDLFSRMVKHFDEPFADSSAIPTYYVTREAAKQVKVCISGDGADELFCGYSRYNYEPLELLLDCIPSSARGLLKPLAQILPDSLPGKGRLGRVAASGRHRWEAMVSAFGPAERRRLLRAEVMVETEAKIFARYFESGKLDAISRRMWADQKTYLPDDILVKVDRNSMWHSLEVRVPFLDHRLVEFANNMPISLKKSGSIQKYVLKAILKDKVPEEILNRRKKGFSLPIKHWLSGSMQEFTREMLDSNNTRLVEYMDGRVLHQLVHQNELGHRDLSRRIWTLLWLEEWCRQVL